MDPFNLPSCPYNVTYKMNQLKQYHTLSILGLSFALISIALTTSFAASARLTKIRVGDYSNYTRIVLDLSNPVKYTVSPKSKEGNKSITITLPETVTSIGSVLAFPKAPLIETITTNRMQGNLMVTLHLRLSFSNYTVFPLTSPDRIVIDLLWPGKIQKQNISLPAKVSDAKERKIEMPSIESKPSKTPRLSKNIPTKKPVTETTIQLESKPSKALQTTEETPTKKPFIEDTIQPEVDTMKDNQSIPSPSMSLPAQPVAQVVVDDDSRFFIPILLTLLLIIALINLFYLIKKLSSSGRSKQAKKLAKLKHEQEKINSLDKLIKNELDKTEK